MPKFDDVKSDDERRIGQAAAILIHTIPEQVEDAMTDYIAVLSIVRKVKDWRAKYIIELLERLYVYPHRSEHKNLVSEVNDLRDELLEERIQRVLSGKGASKLTKKFLGEEKLTTEYPLWWILTVILSLYLLNK